MSPERTTAALDLLASHGVAFRRTALRFSICHADAEDALQRACLILLEKGPPHPRPHLVAWMQMVTRREALAVRRERERLLSGRLTDDAPAPGGCPAERAERVERAAERALVLRRLKPQERRAIVLKGGGYSYAEIQEITGWTYTKVNRCLAEGRARLRQFGAL